MRLRHCGVAVLAAVAAAALAAPNRAAATSCGSVVGDPNLPPAFRVDMESARRTVVFGDSLALVLRYSVDGGRCSFEQVMPEFRARPFGTGFFFPVNLTSAPTSGAPIGFLPGIWWASPTVTTTYKAVWRGALSNGVTVGVRPAVSLRRAGHTAIVSVRAARSFAGRSVRVEARVGQAWRSAGRVRIGAGDTATFRLPRAASAVRVRLPATPGYLPALRTLRLDPR